MAVLGQAGEVFAVGVGHGGELTTDQHLAVELRDHVAHRGVGPSAGIERGIDRAVVVDPGDRVAHRAVIRGEAAADQRLAVGQRNDAADEVIRTGADIVAGVEFPVDVELGQAVAHHRVERGEIAADQDAAIRHDPHGVHVIVRAGRAVERRGGEQVIVGVKLAIRRTGRLLGWQVKLRVRDHVRDGRLLPRVRVDNNRDLGNRFRLGRLFDHVVVAHDCDLGVILPGHAALHPNLAIIANVCPFQHWRPDIRVRGV